MARVFQPLIEVYLLVEQPRQRLSHWTRALAPLDDVGAPPLHAVDAYYDPTATQAIFALRYDDRALGPERLGLVFEVATLAEITTIQPAELSEGDRRRFVSERLARCTVHVGEQRKLVSALVELVRQLRGQRPSTSPQTTPIPAVARAGAVAGHGRTDDGDDTKVADVGDPSVDGTADGTALPFGSAAGRGPAPAGESPLLLGAKGTRERTLVSEADLARSSRGLARGSARQPKLQTLDLDPEPVTTARQLAAIPQRDHLGATSDPVTTPARRLPSAAPQREYRGDTSEPVTTARQLTVTLPYHDAAGEPITTPARQLASAMYGAEHHDAAGEPITTPARRLATALSRAEAQDAAGEPITTPGRHLAGAMRRDDGPRSSANVVTRGGVHRANTVTMSTVDARRMIEAAKVPQGSGSEPQPVLPNGTRPPPRPIERLASPSPVPSMLPAMEAPTVESPRPEPYSEPALVLDPDMIYARYLRDGRWMPTRVGALSLRRATLLAGALPRVDDRVDVALSYTTHRAIVSGTVNKVSTRQEAASTGAATFNVTFELDDSARRQLTTLLTAARAANVTIKPPPPRSTRRYPVEWPIVLSTGRGAVRAEALDVSADGMFVKPLHALTIDATLTFSAVLDDGLSPVSGRARVVRNVTDSEAVAAGLLSGYGLVILDMAEPDRARWGAFLARIEKRAAKRVLIGAGPTRLAELQNGLVAAGYAVTGGSDAGAIAQLASADARPVDAALIDAAWISDGQTATWIESMFSARNVPCVTIHGDARRARIAIDRLLAVV